MNTKVSFKYSWILFIYILLIILIIICFSTNIQINKKYLAHKENDNYVFYIENYNYKYINNNIYINNSLVNDISYSFDDISSSGYIKVVFKFNSNEPIITTDIKIINDKIIDVLIKYLKGDK